MRKFAWRATVALAAAVAGCGGGSGGAPATRSTALADNPPPAGFDFASYQRVRALFSQDFVPEPGRYADPGRTYVAIWTLDAGGQRQSLALLTLRALQALDRQGGLRLDLPRAAAAIGFEVYDRNGPSTSLTGEIRP